MWVFDDVVVAVGVVMVVVAVVEVVVVVAVAWSVGPVGLIAASIVVVGEAVVADEVGVAVVGVRVCAGAAHKHKAVL